MKASLIHGARDLYPGQYGTGATQEITSAAPNNVEGWGRLNIYDSIVTAAPERRYFVDDKSGLSTAEESAYTVTITNTSVPLKVSLAWSDYPGSVDAAKALVNDLDLVMIGPDGNTVYPNSLSSADRLNNVEGIRITSPKSGTYVLKIKGFNIPNGPQPWAVVLSGGIGTMQQGEPTPTPTATSKPLPSPTPTSSPTRTPTPTATSAPTPTATPPSNTTATATPPSNTTATPTPVPAVATIQPTPGATVVVPVPGNQGNVHIPADAGGSSSLQVVVQPVAAPTNVPAGATLLSALQISFTKLTDSSSVSELSQDVTIEMSYAWLGLSEAQIGGLVIYNATRGEYLHTTIDRTRQVAIARTRRFSTFALAQVTAPIPRAFLPFAARTFSSGW